MRAVDEDVIGDDHMIGHQHSQRQQRNRARSALENAVGSFVVFIGRGGIEQQAADDQFFQLALFRDVENALIAAFICGQSSEIVKWLACGEIVSVATDDTQRGLRVFDLRHHPHTGAGLAGVIAARN